MVRISAVVLCFLFMGSVIPIDLSRDWGICPLAEASSVWVTSTVSDFTAPGSYFWNCSVNSTGEGVELRLDSGWGWRIIEPASRPNGRYHFGIATLGTSTCFLLYGGETNIPLTDTWIFNLSIGNWQGMRPQHNPPLLKGFAMAGTSSDDKAVLFGGSQTDGNNTFMLNETWVYDYSDNEWYNYTNPIAPPGRYKAAMAGIEGTDKILLFGGSAGPYTFFNDTWISDV
jgi:hypothetical protein